MLKYDLQHVVSEGVGLSWLGCIMIFNDTVTSCLLIHWEYVIQKYGNTFMTGS